MKKLLLFLAFPLMVGAYNPSQPEPEAPNEPILLTEDLFIEQHLLGDLEGDPDLYEFSTGVSIPLMIELRQRDTNELYPFRLIVVQVNENNGGVSEVARQSIEPGLWSVASYPSLAMRFREAPVLEEELMPGTYRIEVSSPDNVGPYMLVLGQDPDWQGPISGFFSVFATHIHFGVFPLKALLSPYVFIPLAALIATGFWFKRRWDKVSI